MTKQLRIKFLKGTDEIDLPEGNTAMGKNATDDSYVYRANDGNVYLMVSKGHGQVTRFHFHRGDVSGAFPSEQSRRHYMDRINRAAGAVVVVAAEAA